MSAYLSSTDGDTYDNGPHDNSKMCIYKVPRSIRKGKEEAYTPQIVSVGPFHCDDENMDQLKQRYEEKFFERTKMNRQNVLQNIRDKVQDTPNCYPETSNPNTDKILRDAFFIMELLVRNYEEDEKDELLKIPADKLALKLDLLLLENQLPYFLLEAIYDSIVSIPSFRDICLKFFRSFFFHRLESYSEKIYHFTDLLRYNLVYQYSAECGPVNEEDDYLTPLPCATKLHESGVKFTVDSSRCLLAIKFKGGELKMPRFKVHHQTETMLRNIMALEQCHYPGKTLVCDYVILLRDLIEDKRDAQLLVDAGIISNSIGDSKALATLFNKVAAEIRLSGHHYNYIYRPLKDYHKNKYNRNMAKLQRLYFGDIWRGTATFTASALLILTFLQTIASFMQL